MKSLLGNKDEIRICKDMLKVLENNTTKVKLNKNQNANLYVFLNDTIHLSEKQGNKKTRVEDEWLVIAHECIHSIQSKTLQWLNFILSNLEIIIFVIAIILKLFFKENNILTTIYVLVLMCSITLRLYLELNAIIKSFKLTNIYLLGKKTKEERIKIFRYYKNKIVITVPLFVIGLFGIKILRLVLIII
ncbi:MAG: hypothetical protein PHR25_00655 [Clostridia bacterium]|nr:hypothetical protein [Clostridia bacterium]MDD4375278.1 hypothetical protein [Clostridia bacterium]